MKKTSLLLLLLVLAIAGFSVLGFGQGVITFDEGDAVGPKVFCNFYNDWSVRADTNIDINVELLYSVDGSAYAPVVTLLLSVTNGPVGQIVPIGAVEPAYGDITYNLYTDSGYGDGTLHDFSGNEYQFPSIPPGTVVNFIVKGWMDIQYVFGAGEPYPAPFGWTKPFQETLSDPNSPILANISNMPELRMILIPEPGTMALAGLGFGALLMLGYRER